MRKFNVLFILHLQFISYWLFVNKIMYLSEWKNGIFITDFVACHIQDKQKPLKWLAAVIVTQFILASSIIHFECLFTIYESVKKITCFILGKELQGAKILKFPKLGRCTEFMFWNHFWCICFLWIHCDKDFSKCSSSFDLLCFA